MNAFTHRPTGRDLQKGVFFHPTATRILWNRVWDEARKQPWFEEKIGCVGNDGKGRFYFQKSGLTTGFAMIEVK